MSTNICYSPHSLFNFSSKFNSSLGRLTSNRESIQDKLLSDLSNNQFSAASLWVLLKTDGHKCVPSLNLADLNICFVK